MNYQVSMKCYDCSRAGTHVKFIPERYSHASVGCKVCNNRLRVRLPRAIHGSIVEKNSHLMALCYKKP